MDDGLPILFYYPNFKCKARRSSSRIGSGPVQGNIESQSHRRSRARAGLRSGWTQLRGVSCELLLSLRGLSYPYSR